MTDLKASGVGEPPPPYMIFLVVFLFFMTGLLGFLICHLLKKKGYRCRTGDMEEEEEEGKLGEDEDGEHEENQDTVEQILKCILENEANMEAFNEMFVNQNVCVRHDPRLRKESIGGVPPHLHTVHSGTDHNTCHLCAQGRAKKGRRQSRTPRTKRPWEQTVFSVGRFRVIHTDKRLHGGATPLATSGDQLDRSQDSEDRKEGGYNLRSMFKEVRRPSEGANGISGIAGRRKKSVTIFGLRRGSDPAGVRVKEATGREFGEVKFSFQQPVVLEEPRRTAKIKADPEHSIKPGTKSEPELVSAQCDAKSSGHVTSPSIQSKTKALSPSSSPKECSELGASPQPTNTMTTTPTGTTVASAPSYLTISSERRVNVDNKMLKMEEAYDPGPLQTSTPIAPIPTSIPGFIPVMPIELHSTKSFSVDQTPPDPSSSPDLEPGFGTGLHLISLGSSPLASLAESPSLQSTSDNVPSEGIQAAFSPGPAPSPKLLLPQEMSSQECRSSSSLGPSGSPAQSLSLSLSRDDQNLRPTLKSLSVRSETPVIKGNVSSSSAIKVQEAEGSTIPKTEEKIEIKRPGILKTSKLSPVATGDPKGSGFSSPSDQPVKDKLSSLPSPHFGPASPSSPESTRISSVTIVKASPDSKREFSVVTMVEDEGTPTSITDQKGRTSEHERRTGGPAASQQGKFSVSSVEEPESESKERSGMEVRPTLTKDNDDLMEMEDIRDCKVTQVEGAERKENYMMQMQSKQD
ncbi:uncharacterized protein LOC133447306 isoform X1 [Cololabis saira]|uniref:uncharacterized protein LOC133447306 isoform X1 n=1 Tax=Cololabis saira TaxID=129043 RepID=UPI002AD4C3D8|nr:uncharacterized protein LOC133447306 isoform X1 [Cololabis saira]XP_061581933.1 uncharacterized protein LOC133447306 isoform X1 [Cololabis saira]XP_061581934.1 uncharacterized protein LOC133447306 isoform X1 [Cololabis saira]